MGFDIVFLLSLIVVMLFAILIGIMAYPGPKREKHR